MLLLQEAERVLTATPTLVLSASRRPVPGHKNVFIKNKCPWYLWGSQQALCSITVGLLLLVCNTFTISV